MASCQPHVYAGDTVTGGTGPPAPGGGLSPQLVISDSTANPIILLGTLSHFTSRRLCYTPSLQFLCAWQLWPQTLGTDCTEEGQGSPRRQLEHSALGLGHSGVEHRAWLCQKDLDVPKLASLLQGVWVSEESIKPETCLVSSNQEMSS